MSRVRVSAVLAALALGIGATARAHAEFFGCNDHSGRVVYHSGWHHGGSHYARYSRLYVAQPHRSSRVHVTYSSARRYYDSRYR